MLATAGDRLKALLVVGAIFVALEIVDAFRIEETLFALVFAALTAGMLVWTWSGRFGGAVVGPLVLILLALMELAGVTFIYPRPETVLVWIDYAVFAVLSVAIVLLSVLVLRDRKSRPETL